MSASPQRRGFLFYSSIPTRSCSISSLICLPACRRGAATAPVTVSEALSRSWWSSPERIRVSSCARTDGSSRGWPWQRVTLDPLACAPVFLGLRTDGPGLGRPVASKPGSRTGAETALQDSPARLWHKCMLVPRTRVLSDHYPFHSKRRTPLLPLSLFSLFAVLPPLEALRLRFVFTILRAGNLVTESSQHHICFGAGRLH